MQRTTASGNVSNQFSDGVPGVSSPTVVDATFMNSAQEELCNAVTSDGTTLDVTNQHQLQNAIASILLAAIVPGGRLTLSSGTPITTTDQTNKTTIYYTPFKHTRIPLFNGTRWVNCTFAELSQATTDTTHSPAAVAASTSYDLYVWLNAGVPTLSRGAAWASATSRGTGANSAQQTTQDGRVVNAVAITNGPAANCGLWVGTVTSASNSTLIDSQIFCHVWNTFNRVERHLYKPMSDSGYTYSSGTTRQANSNTNNQIEHTVGALEDLACVTATMLGVMGTANSPAFVDIGINSITAGAAADLKVPVGFTQGGLTTSIYQGMSQLARVPPQLGRNYYALLETGDGTHTVTFYSGSGSSPGVGAVVWA